MLLIFVEIKVDATKPLLAHAYAMSIGQHLRIEMPMFTIAFLVGRIIVANLDTIELLIKLKSNGLVDEHLKII